MANSPEIQKLIDTAMSDFGKKLGEIVERACSKKSHTPEQKERLRVIKSLTDQQELLLMAHDGMTNSADNVASLRSDGNVSYRPTGWIKWLMHTGQLGTLRQKNCNNLVVTTWNFELHSDGRGGTITSRFISNTNELKMQPELCPNTWGTKSLTEDTNFTELTGLTQADLKELVAMKCTSREDFETWVRAKIND